MRKRLWDLAKSRIEIGTILPGHRHKVPAAVHTLLPPARGAPQAPQAARSAAAGGGQQVRKIKRHFRFRGFGTVYQLCGTNRLALGLSPALRLSLHSESVRRREGSRSGLRTPLCADKRYGAE